MFALEMWSTSLITISTGYLRLHLRLARSSSNEQLIQRIEVSSGHQHNYSSVRPEWSINPRRLIHNLLLLMTPWLALFSIVVDLTLWTHTPKANHIVWETSILSNVRLWDKNYKKEGIMTRPRVNKMKERRFIKQRLT